MMGLQTGGPDQLFYAFNLEDHIPSNHLLRGINQFLDLSDLRRHLSEFYSHTGRPSIDPELMVRMLVIGNREHAARIVNSRAAVIILSDGYDTGEPAALSGALALLRRRARSLVWLNPLGNQPGYAPISQGMQAALPHLDLLAPGGDLNSIKALLPKLIEALG